MTEETAQEIRIFVSYAREECRYLGYRDEGKRWVPDDESEFALIPWLAKSFKRYYHTVFWYDTKDLTPSQNFKERIEREIDQADIAILLISSAFLNSDFIQTVEFPRICERVKNNELKLVSILVEPCAWEKIEFVSFRTILPGKPTPLIDFIDSEKGWRYIRKEILDGVEREIIKVLDERGVKRPRLPPPPPDRSTVPDTIRHRMRKRKMVNAGMALAALIALSLGIGWALLHYWADPVENENALFADGMERYAEEDYEKAMELFERVLILNPDRSDAAEQMTSAKAAIEEREQKAKKDRLFSDGMERYTEEDYEGAMEFFGRVLDLNPDRADAAEQMTSAKAAFREQMEARKKKEQEDALFAAGMEQYGAGEYEDAIQTFGQLLDLNPERTDAAGQIARAEEAIERALEEERRREESIERLSLALDDPDSDIRERAAEALGTMGAVRAVEQLISALEDDDAGVRQYAAEALGRIGDERAIQSLISAVDDRHRRVRQYAAEALGRVGDIRAVPPLIAALEDRHAGVRNAAIEALGNLGELAAAELISSLDDDNRWVRLRAAEALGKTGSLQAAEPLINLLLEDPDARVRHSASQALEQISGIPYGSDVAQWMIWLEGLTD